MASVSGKRSQAKGHLDHIHIRRMANGFSVHKQYAHQPGSEGMSRPPDEAPAVFTKHSAAHKFVKGAMAEMHPPGPGEEAPEPAAAPISPMQG